MTILHFPFANDGCTHYRIKLPLLELERRGHTLIEINPKMPDAALTEAVKRADVWFMRASDSGLIPLIGMVRQFNPKLAIVMDTDDDLFDVTPLNNSYSTVGQTEVQNSDGTFIWQDGKQGFDLRRNWHWLVDYRWTLRQADVVTTTTDHLKERLEEHNDLVAVIPNALNLEDFPKLSLPHKGTRIVWSGGSSHFEDLWMVKPALTQLLETYPDVELHLAGQTFKAITKDMPKGQVFTHPWVHPTGHGFRLATLGCDIGIAPVVDNRFNHAKSSIKYYEYSALGLATVASNTLPYSDDVQGERGVLADPQHFYDALVELVNDPIKRASLAREAYGYVSRHRTMTQTGKDWEQLFEAAARQKQEANA